MLTVLVTEMLPYSLLCFLLLLFVCLFVLFLFERIRSVIKTCSSLQRIRCFMTSAVHLASRLLEAALAWGEASLKKKNTEVLKACSVSF